MCGGERIRTSDAIAGITVFKTALFVRSSTPPTPCKAEGVGFEPTEPFRAQHISSVLLSAAQPPFHIDIA